MLLSFLLNLVSNSKKKPNQKKTAVKMTITDGLHYIAVGNPLSKTIIGTTTALLGKSSDKIKVNKM